jgi:phosphopantothenoylcysteine decarboxylase/phosphopantothenate--cysteine ligase
MFAPGAALEHISLCRWSDAVVVCPATASSLNRLSAGLADDLPGALFLAHDRAKPWLMVPAMNPSMWAHPATQASVSRLEEWGVRILPVASGRTACGELGEGRMIEPGAVVREVRRSLARPARRLRVLITGGGTSEAVDAVRVLTNTSTGRTAALIANHLDLAGHDVVLLRAASAVPAHDGVRQPTFTSFADLDGRLSELLGATEFDAVVHAAAVSDFGVESVQVDGREADRGGKVPSAGEVTLKLFRHPKLIDRLRRLSANPRIVVVGFKLAGGGGPTCADAVRDLFERGVADLVVFNDAAWRDGAFPAQVHRPDGAVIHCKDRMMLATELERLLVAASATQEPSNTQTHAPHAALP